MEKELNESKPETLESEVESTESPTLTLGESRDEGENAGKSDSFPPQKITNPPETNQEEPSPLEGRVAELEKQLEQSETQRNESEEKLSTARKSLAEAVSRYRTMLLESMPEAPESMVIGETVDEVDRSFNEAKALVRKVRREVEEKLAKERLPAGSPTRSPADFSSLTPIEKIRSALSKP